MSPYLARIDIYPVKSLDGMTMPSIEVLPTGALRHDRTFALFDAADKFVNGKRHARIHQVRSRFSNNVSTISVWTNHQDEDVATCSLTDGSRELEQWFSHYFGQTITVRQNEVMGFRYEKWAEIV